MQSVYICNCDWVAERGIGWEPHREQDIKRGLSLERGLLQFSFLTVSTCLPTRRPIRLPSNRT
jgi:hypothetical protein